jgi:hypothetical protein
MDLPRDLIDLLAEFARANVEVVLVGGHAVSFHSVPRATKDFDLLLANTDGNLERAADALGAFGAPRNVVDATRSMKDDEIVYLGQPPQRIDLLRRIDGVTTADVFAHAVQTKFSGIDVKIISLDDLIANKKASGRPLDLIDVATLERVKATE